MRVREATSNDLDALVRIGTRALVNSKIEGYLCPERTKFPEAYRTWYRGRVAAALLAPYTLLLVAEREPADGGVGGEEDVVAYAAWHFKQAVSAKHAVMPSGLPPGVQLAKDSLEYRIARAQQQALATVASYVPALFGESNPAVDASHVAEFDELMRVPKAYAGDGQAHWHLAVLATDPEAQRQGAGTMLVRWGITQADADGLLAGLEAAEGKHAFYGKFGFKVVVSDGEIGPARWSTLRRLPQPPEKQEGKEGQEVKEVLGA